MQPSTPTPTPNDIRSMFLAFMDMKHIVDVFLHKTPLDLLPRYQQAIDTYARLKVKYEDS